MTKPIIAGTPAIPNPTQVGDQARSLAERRAAWTFSSIANLAEAVRTICIDVIDDGAETWDYTVHKVVAARELCAQIGAMADIGIMDVGDPLSARHHDAKGWLLPPSYHAEGDKEQS